jgi:hypothetical protein
MIVYISKIADCEGCVEMIHSKRFFFDSQCPFELFKCLIVLALTVVNVSEIVDRVCSTDMIGSVGTLTTIKKFYIRILKF